MTGGSSVPGRSFTKVRTVAEVMFSASQRFFQNLPSHVRARPTVRQRLRQAFWPTPPDAPPSGGLTMATPFRNGCLRPLERDSQDLADLDQVGVADPVPVGSEQPRPQIAVAVAVLRDAEQCVTVDDGVLRKSGIG
jgi:hypothetical protein